MITKLISGGQTGADRGGHNAAIHCGLPHGGWCPCARKAEEISAECHKIQGKDQPIYHEPKSIPLTLIRRVPRL